MKGVSKTNKMRALVVPSMILLTLFSCVTDHSQNILIGSWKPKRYIMNDGNSKTVDGHIFFSDRQWSVVFFVLDDKGNPINGSAEGGEYKLENDNLTFWHHYNLSDITKGTSGNLTKTIYDEDHRQKELCRIEVEEDVLVIYFPSGNSMIFQKVIYNK